MSEAIEIPLMNSHKTVLIDKEDYELVSKYRWYMSYNGYVRASVTIGSLKYKQATIHRFVMGVLDKPEILVDHVGGNKLDNRKGELRLCNKAQNGHNQGMQRTNTSGFKGVTRTSKGGWTAQIRCNGKRVYIGSFPTPELAAHEYNKVAIRLHGEFAVLNPVGGSYAE